MTDLTKYNTINIRKYFEFENPKDGEDLLSSDLSDFSCPKNPDVEKFLKQQAIEFTKKNQSVTYLIYSAEDAELLGYFTLTSKPITINVNSDTAETISKTIQRKISRVSEYDAQSGTYTLSAYLIAQLGKNYTGGANEKISGEDILGLAVQKIKEMQYIGGGMVMFLETENSPQLMKFYKKQNGFKQFDIRETVNRENVAHTYIQLLKII